MLTRIVVLVAALATSAHAQTARHDCLAPLPHKGQTFAGRARLVVDGDTLCVGPGADHAGWVYVRVSDFYAPEHGEPGGAEAKRQLQRITGRRWIVCEAEHRSFGRIVARCTVAGATLGDRMRSAGVAEGGRGWK